jgi:hypothetical protein
MGKIRDNRSKLLAAEPQPAQREANNGYGMMISRPEQPPQKKKNRERLLCPNGPTHIDGRLGVTTSP